MKKCLVVTVLAVGALGALTACDPKAADGTTHTVVLSVSGPMRGDVQYISDGALHRLNNISLPWAKQLETKGEKGITVTADATATKDVIINCVITVDGVKKKVKASIPPSTGVTCTWDGVS